MAKLKDIIAGLSQQSFRKLEAVAKVNEELNQLRDAYQRYQEKSAWMVPESESAKIGMALVFSAPLKMSDADPYDPKYRRVLEDVGTDIDVHPDDLDLSRYPLWKIMREILRQVPEMRVYELEAHLKSFGVDAKRSAIESAIKTHRKQFKVIPRGREKFVAWKESYASSTN